MVFIFLSLIFNNDDDTGISAVGALSRCSSSGATEAPGQDQSDVFVHVDVCRNDSHVDIFLHVDVSWGVSRGPLILISSPLQPGSVSSATPLAHHRGGLVVWVLSRGTWLNTIEKSRSRIKADVSDYKRSCAIEVWCWMWMVMLNEVSVSMAESDLETGV